MSSPTPPSSNRSPLHHHLPADSGKPKPSEQLDSAVEQAAQGALSSPPAPAEEASRGWGSFLYSLWNGTGAEEQSAQGSRPEDFEERSRERSGSGSSSEGASDGFSEGSEQQGLLDQQGLGQRDMFRDEQSPFIDEEDEVDSAAFSPRVAQPEVVAAQQEVDAEAAARKAQFDRTTQKTEEKGSNYFQTVNSVLAYTSPANLGMHVIHAAKSGIAPPARVQEKSKQDKIKQGKLDESKRNMLAYTNDPQFIQFYEMINSLLKGTVRSQIANGSGAFISVLWYNLEWVINTVEINLAKGFENLARQTYQSQGQIPNYANQPSLVNILSLFCRQGSEHLSAARLNQIEEQFRPYRDQLSAQTKQKFPEIAKKPEQQTLIQKLIRELRQELEKQDGDRDAEILRHKILPELFPDFDTAEGERRDEINGLILCARHQMLHSLFSKLADDILFPLFPHRFADMEIPWVLKCSVGGINLADWLYNSFAKSSLVDFLQGSYESLEDDATRKEAWKNDLQARSGLSVQELEPVIQAPSAFALAFAKDFIQSNPNAVAYTVSALNTLTNPSAPEAGASASASAASASASAAAAPAASAAATAAQKEDPMAQLAQFPFANWFVESTQAMLHTEDPNLLGLGHFVEKSFSNLTLALLANGAKLAIPEGEVVGENQFIKVLTDLVTAKFKALGRGAVIPDQVWKDFVNELPLPPLLKRILLPIVIAKSKELQAMSQDQTAKLDKINKLYIDTELEVRGFNRGEELLSISNKISDLIIGRLLGKNIDLISTFGLGDTVEELLAQYLPGVKIDDTLKDWFKKNLSSLGSSGVEGSLESVAMLKRGVQALILKALANTIKKNIQRGDDYAAQLLHNIHQAFISALSGFGESQRKELEEAFKVQSKIHAKKEEIEALEDAQVKKPEGLTLEQNSLLDNILQANTRYTRAQQYIVSLNESLDETFKKLNEVPANEVPANEVPANEVPVDVRWSRESLPLIRQAMAFDQAGQAIASNGDVLLMHWELVGMSPDKLKLISDAVSLGATLKHAEEEAVRFDKERHARSDEVNTLDLAGDDPEKWMQATIWLIQTLNNREALQQLTKDVADLYKELDTHLEMFKDLSTELMKLVGLDNKEDLDLPPSLQEMVWPYWPHIESAKSGLIARELFEQTAPMILVIANLERNKERLKQLSKDDPFLIQLAEGTSAELVGHLSDYITNYRPFATQILTLLGVRNPSPLEIARMESSLRLMMIDKGKEEIEY